RRRHTRLVSDWSSDVCSSDLHIAPQPADVRACDRAGIIQICPAGDKEKDVTGRQWEQRKEVMRDTIVYFRNSPSVLFWEAGNNRSEERRVGKGWRYEWAEGE